MPPRTLRLLWILAWATPRPLHRCCRRHLRLDGRDLGHLRHLRQLRRIYLRRIYLRRIRRDFLRELLSYGGPYRVVERQGSVDASD